MLTIPVVYPKLQGVKSLIFPVEVIGGGRQAKRETAPQA
jgi:hypothetical protein